MKTVKRSDLEKLVYGVARVFEAQDDEYTDRRTMAARERAVCHYLENITSSAEEQRKIREAAEHSLWACKVGEALEKQMREMGYEIEEEKGE